MPGKEAPRLFWMSKINKYKEAIMLISFAPILVNKSKPRARLDMLIILIQEDESMLRKGGEGMCGAQVDWCKNESRPI